MRSGGATVAALEAIYRDRFSAFVRVAESIVGDGERARDAVQDGFADALRARHGFRGEGAVDGWVWRCVVNAARMAARGARGTPLPADGLRVEVEERISDLAPLITELPERQRLAVFLRYYVGLDYQAIATAMDVEVGTVSATLATAHATLRKRLREAEAHA